MFFHTTGYSREMEKFEITCISKKKKYITDSLHVGTYISSLNTIKISISENSIRKMVFVCMYPFLELLFENRPT